MNKKRGRQKVLVTGASGFTGRYVINELLERGYEVVGVSRRKPQIINDNFKFISADLRCILDIERLEEIAARYDAVFHLAADIRIPGDGDSIESNVKGTYNILQFSKKLNIKKFIYLSSVPVIGAPLQIPITEKHIIKPLTVYHMTKLWGEQLVECICSESIEWTVIRIPSPVGMGMGKSLFYTLLEKAMQNEQIEIYGAGTRIQSYIDIRDLAHGLITAMEKSDGGLFLLSGKTAISDIGLARLVVDIIGSKSDIISDQRINVEDGNSWIVSYKKASLEWGYAPEFGLEETIHWMYDGIKNETGCIF